MSAGYLSFRSACDARNLAFEAPSAHTRRLRFLASKTPRNDRYPALYLRTLNRPKFSASHPTKQDIPRRISKHRPRYAYLPSPLGTADRFAAD